tara:strand:- start:278 stop:1333 length:1056 start_codon:yes stop_codon:yes gene_type:complete
MFVIIDSNIFVQNYDAFESVAFQRFVRHFPEKLISVGISKVTLLEVFKNHKKDITREIESFEKQVRSINRHLVNKLSYSLKKDLNNEVVSYQNYFSNQLDFHDIKVFPIPEISHSSILEFANRDRKPFDNKDNGYKDFLIWLTIVEKLKNSKRPLVLISNDKDFGTSDQIHDDLKTHLKELNITPTRITICKSIAEFNEKYLTEVYDLVELKDFFKSTKEVLNYSNYVEDEIIQICYNENLFDHNLNLDRRFEHAFMDDLQFVDDFKISGLDKVGTDSIAISFECHANAEISVAFNHDEYFELIDKVDGISGDLNDFTHAAFIYQKIKITGTFIIRDDIYNVIQKEIQFSI